MKSTLFFLAVLSGTTAMGINADEVTERTQEMYRQQQRDEQERQYREQQNQDTPDEQDPKQTARRIVGFDTWMSIAHNPETDSLGLTGLKGEVETTKESAEKSAMALCKNNGGGNGCKILLSYTAGCASLAVGMDKSGQAKLLAVGAKYKKRGFGAGDEAKKRADKSAMQQCSSQFSSCQILNTSCAIVPMVEQHL